MRIPEHEIYKLLNLFLDVTRDDFNANSGVNSFLYHIFGDNDTDIPERLKISTYDFFEQSKTVILRKDHPRSLKFSLGYNMEKANVPTIHITLPSESPKNAGIGANEGYEDEIVDKANRKYKAVFTSDYSVTYNLLITSDNMNEVLLIYNWLKCVMLSMHEQVEFRGFQNATFSGSDLSIDEDMVPNHIFCRNFNLAFTYDFSVPSLISRAYGTGVSVAPPTSP